MNFQRLLPLGILFALLMSFAAEASARVAVLDFKGPKASKARAQFMKSLCKAEKCVKPGRGGEDVEVDAAVSGSVKKVKGKLKLVIEIYSSEEEPPVTKSYALKASGKLDAKILKGAVKAVRAALTELESEQGDELASAE
jgi:hypothetical protein